ncbi:hypothetical protein YB2330_004076 [Saitoella coloradoensis]
MSTDQIILYHYPPSPWAQKVTNFLAVSGTSYTECKQPMVLPRPDLSLLGINYRRIPLMAVGKDVYCDTRLILDRLVGGMGQAPVDGIKDSERWRADSGLVRGLEIWAGAKIFPIAPLTFPASFPIFKNKQFLKDREAFSGRSWQPEHLAKVRPGALAEFKAYVDIIENEVLADGRDWVLGTEKCGMGDVQLSWVVDWVINGLGATKGLIDQDTHPKTCAWLSRFRKAVKDGTTTIKRSSIKGEEAKAKILATNTFADVQHDEKDPQLGDCVGQDVSVVPEDTGTSHPQVGKLVAANSGEVVVEVQVASGEGAIRVHFPRIGFRVVKGGKGAKL